MGKQARKVYISGQRKAKHYESSEWTRTYTGKEEALDRVTQVEVVPREHLYLVIARWAGGCGQVLAFDKNLGPAATLADEWRDWYRANGMLRDDG